MEHWMNASEAFWKLQLYSHWIYDPDDVERPYVLGSQLLAGLPQIQELSRQIYFISNFELLLGHSLLIRLSLLSHPSFLECLALRAPIHSAKDAEEVFPEGFLALANFTTVATWKGVNPVNPVPLCILYATSAKGRSSAQLVC